MKSIISGRLRRKSKSMEILWNAAAGTVRRAMNAGHRQSNYQILPGRTIPLSPYFRDTPELEEPTTKRSIHQIKTCT